MKSRFCKEEIRMIQMIQMIDSTQIGYHSEVKGKRFDIAFDEGHQKIKAKVFQVFTKNPRQFKIEYVSDSICEKTKASILKNNYQIFSHASYLLNMANPDKWDEKVQNGICELINIHKIGGIGTVFHVGKRLKLSVEIGLDYMEKYIVEVLTGLYQQYPEHHVYYIIETSCGAGTELLHQIGDLGQFHKRFTSDKYLGNIAVYGRVKLCIDTAHIFAAGWKLHGKDGAKETCDLIEKELKWENIACIHLNDSAKLFHSCVDRHANIGKGFIGNDLKHFLEKSLTLSIPHILETPSFDESDFITTHRSEIDLIQKWFSS